MKIQHVVMAATLAVASEVGVSMQDQNIES